MSSNSVTSTAREHVFPLFVKYVSANVLGMIGYSCYILADTFFVARGIGSDAIAALNLVLPAFSLLNGTGLMIGMGAAARYSLSSGRADSEIHRTIFTQALQLAFYSYAVLFQHRTVFCKTSLCLTWSRRNYIAACNSIHPHPAYVLSAVFVQQSVELFCQK